MIIENRSKNLQRLNFSDETIILEVGNNTLNPEQFDKIKSHNAYKLLTDASILKVIMPLGIIDAKEVFEDVEPEVLREERVEDAINIKIKKSRKE